MNIVNWNSLFFLLFAAIACIAAVAVVLSSNIVRMACYLVVSLAAVAMLFFLAGADFLGAAQLMVYVGGTLVLIVFGVMLTARGPFVSMKTGAGQWILAILVGGALLAVLLQAAFTLPGWIMPEPTTEIAGKPPQTPCTSESIGLGLLGIRPDRLEPQVEASQTGGMAGYLLPFEIISVHLVVVLIGAAYLARAKRRLGRGARN